MKNVFAALGRHRRAKLHNEALQYDKNSKSVSQGYRSLQLQQFIEVSPRQDACFPSFFLQHNMYSTGYTSVHGGIPTAEYAKLRRESLESEFGHALGTYSSKSFSAVYRFGPFLALYRAAIISFHFLKLTVWHLFVHDLRKRAAKFRETLIHLGPFYVKLGQALSTRPDILPSIYCQELAKLLDQIPPYSTEVAIKSIESQLGVPVAKVFADISPEPVAAASLGQVYKAHLHSGELVAVKVQRPGISLSLTLDALLFHMIGGQLKRFAKARKDLLVAVNEMVRHMFDEIDYVLEGKNAERFASLYCYDSSNYQTTSQQAGRENIINHKKAYYIKVPKIYWDFTSSAVLTMEWIDGIKLTDKISLQKACLNRRELIDQGLYCSLRQLLEVGFFHADPHPGNLVATECGALAYFDFGMMGDIPRHFCVGLIQILVHFVNRDSRGLANDFLSLGFIPEGVNIQAVSSALDASFSSGTGHSLDFQGVMDQLYDVMYAFDFCLPPDYALVIRALGSLEGTAKVLDPDFKVIESSYPFVVGRLLDDPSPDMRKILMELVIRDDGSIRWNRLERLVAAISEQASESPEELTDDKGQVKSSRWKSFDMCSVVSATEDLLLFLLSAKGKRVRVFLLQDIIGAADILLEEEFLCCVCNRNSDPNKRSKLMDESWSSRLVNGFRCLRRAIKLAPEMWTAMLVRMALKPEVHSYVSDVVSALCAHLSRKGTQSCWLRMSELLHVMSRIHRPPDDL